MRRGPAILLALSVSATFGAVASGDPSPPVNKLLPAVGDMLRALRAREAIIGMDLPVAKSILDGADLNDAVLAVEQSRYAIYAGDYDEAASLLSRPDLAKTDEGASLGDTARGCARGMAATVEVRDDDRGVVVRLQDDDDRALVPMLADVAVEVRATLLRDLGVELPKPLRIDLVRDQQTLAAMTGLPEAAARTTGTVAVAKWGRVTMISPRATAHGYPWLDTLAHEMTHLALSRGTLDRAPLWLQEGVAKREETRWREAQPLDDVPPVDTVAFVGLEKGLGRSLDQLGPSIAMLPTAEQAAVAYAEVASFFRYWAKEVGPDGLPQLVMRIRSTTSAEEIDRAIEEVSGADLAGWDKKWRAYLAAGQRTLPTDLAPGARLPHANEIAKRVRLGELLEARGHHQAAAVELGRAQHLAPADASVRAFMAASLLGMNERASAAMLVDKTDELHNRFGRWWSLHALLHSADATRAFGYGVSLDPLDPWVACEETAAPALPEEPTRGALCEAARRVPR